MRHRENVQHLDDSTIQAMLDRELSDAENEAAATHAEECAACAARIAEERFIMSEADRLITELDAPQAAAPREVSPPPPGFVSGEGALGEGAPLEPMKRGAPVVLMPGAADPRWQRRPRPGRYAAWAAMVAVAAGAGYFAYEARSGNPAASDVASDVPASVAPVAAPEGEMALVDSPAAGGSAAGQLGASAGDDAAVTSDAETAEAEPPSRAAAEPPSPAPQRPTAAELAAADRQAEREADERDAAREAALEQSRLSAAAATRQRARMAAASQPAPERSRAEEVARAEPPVAAPQPAQRPPLEQQAQIAFRLGLDEAQRMLGGIPVHAIEGLQPELVGAVQGHLVPGADATAYVVRVVYLDDDGRMILLDQQRLSAEARASGAGRDTTPPFWVKGDVRLRLTGQVPRETIADLAARVR